MATDIKRMLKYKDFFGFMPQEALYPDQELKRRISKTDRSIAKEAMELHKRIGYKKAINKEIFEKEQYFFNIIETEKDETKKFNQNILLATEYGSRNYGIEELEDQIENSKSGKIQNISNQPHAPSQELLNSDNHKQESTLNESRSKKATSSPSLSIEEEFTRETSSFNKNKIKCTIWDIPNETTGTRIRKSLSFYRRTTIQSTMANGKSKAIYVKIVIPEEVQNQTESSSTRNRNREEESFRNLNKQKGLESLGKENRPLVSHSHKNTNNSNFSSKGSYYRESARPTKKNILYKKLKKEASNNLRPNKFNKNSTSVILKKDVISLSRIYKSLKYQYKTTKAASLSVDIVVDFNCQIREINEKYGLKIMLKKEKSKRVKDLVNQQYTIIKNEQGRMIQSLLEKPFCKVLIDRVLSNVNSKFFLSTDPKEVLTKTEAYF
ncbi:43456_t:CDS:2 [Gigaspora margarita]|uniref:43456_t:CDS:1 n=1 Tax=Gigaspora margarita TaxID=4874 RepID=A0ABN7V7N0_GIGMA|nr:43456_t:CDS:2 [Gigaspora margarita]